jgi:hypothetical protein
MLQLIDGILSNGSAGLIDLNLLQAQKVLSANAYSSISNDYSIIQLSGEPKEGQTLEQVRDLLSGRSSSLARRAIRRLAHRGRGERPPPTPHAHLGREQRRSAAAMTDAFILKKRWSEEVDLYDRMAKITKAEVVAFANQHR